MKYKKAVKKYFAKRITTIDYFLKLNPKNYKPETFHRLRTEIKKINAVLDILNHCVKSFKRTKTFEPLEIIFKSAGDVRDVQVKKALFEKYKISLTKNGFAAQLQKELRETKEKFNKQITKKIISGVKKNLAAVTEVIAAVKHKVADSYFKNEEEKIKEMLMQELKPEKVHELRRQLKTFYYSLRAGGWSRNDVPLAFDRILNEARSGFPVTSGAELDIYLCLSSQKIITNLDSLSILCPLLVAHQKMKPRKMRGFHSVGATGFEPATTCTPCKCATGLRYAPNKFSFTKLICAVRDARLLLITIFPACRGELHPSTRAQM